MKNMAQLKIIRADEIEPESIRGSGDNAGQVKRIIATEKFFFNIDEVNPGHSPHHWHRHAKYKTETHEVDYPADFEEIYYILSGQGVMQWKSESGEINEQEVGPGDTVFTPPDVVEHQLLNNGSEPIRMAVVGAPPSRRTPLR
jgi:oxalate decarboxylase/phosphoglucose isomerase-like protein (cupin superfamily)